MGLYFRRPRLFRRARILPRSIRIGPLPIWRRGSEASLGPIGYRWRTRGWATWWVNRKKR